MYVIIFILGAFAFIPELFREKKVFINSRLCEKESAVLKEGDIVSVRGYGRFIFKEEIRTTKRGRLAVRVYIYK